MARKKRIFREWQHPRASDGKFTRGAGTKSWADRAEKMFKAALPAEAPSASAPGRPRIGRAAKGAALFEAHREGARPSAVRAPKAATITPAPAPRNLAAFNAPDAPKASKLPTKKRPSTFTITRSMRTPRAFCTTQLSPFFFTTTRARVGSTEM